MKISVTQKLLKASTSRKLLWEKMMLTAFFLFLATLFAQAQNTTVRGRITNEKNVPVADVSVVIKGTSIGTTTDANGEYQITAPSNGTLVISSVGYPTKEIPVNRQATHNITLTTSSTDMEQVVVIGYGSQRKADVTGSTVSVKGETLNEIKAPNVFNQLQGRAAGVDIVTNGTSIGTAGQIRIRGNRSLSGNNDPLIVVDGMAYGGSINDINPENVASIDILKDASATAIYGSRGSNGVIIITTKHGTTGKPVTTYNGYIGQVSVIGTYRLFNGQEYAQFKSDAGVGNSNVPNPSPTTNPYALTATEQANLAKGINTDWQNLLLTKGIRTSHDVNVRGGTERTQYFFGMGYYRETGVIHDQELDRYSFNVNIDHKISDRVKVGFTSFNTLLRSNRTGTNAYGSATRLSPLFKPYNDDGTINLKPAIDQSQDGQQINPLTSIGNNDLIVAFQRRLQIQDNFYGEVNIIRGLKFRTTFGYGWSQTLNDNYNGPNTVFNTNPTTAGSSLSQANAEGWQYTVNNSFEYNTTFSSKHKIQAQVLQEIQKNHFQQQQFNGVGIPANFMQDYNWQQVSTTTPQGGNFTESGLIGYMGRAIYSYQDKYQLTATIRTDGASVLAPGHQWTTYPAISLGWNLNREKFMEGINALSLLKIRAGWGISANAGIAPYTTLGSLSNNFYNFGQGTTVGVNFQNGYLINTAPNPDLTWEKTTGLNIGVDYGLFNNRLSGSVDYFTTKTDDILLTKGLPRSLGVNSILTNVGKTSSWGMEFNVSALIVKSTKEGGFSWRADGNAFFSREKIVALQNDLTQDLGNGWFVGQPLTVIYDYKKIGIWQTADSAQAKVYGVAPGDIRIEDVDKSNSITAADRQIIGDFQPKVIAGLSNHLEYKNFDLNFVLFGRFGQTVVVSYLSADGGAGGYPFFLNSRVEQYKVNYWTPTNPTNDFPQPDAGKDALTYTSTLTYRDGSFIKVRTIDLGYTFTRKLLGKSGIQSLRAYVSAQNPFILWSPLVNQGLGLDPEGNSGNNSGGGTNTVSTQGGGATAVPSRAIIVNMGVPPTRQFIIGVNVRF